MNQLYIDWGSPPFYRSWSGNVPCSMIHVTCDNFNNVVGIDLDSNRTQTPPVIIRGSFPTQLLLITSLTTLILKNNAMNGTLPQQLFTLAQLAELDISGNQFTGIISQQFFSARRSLLSLANDPFLRSLQSSPNVESLVVLDFSRNRLFGTVPQQLSMLTGLKHLNISHNQLTGSIPQQLSYLQLLESVSLEANLLGSSVPSQLSTLSFLTALSIGSNKLTASVPSQYSTLYSLVLMLLGNNMLVGSLPAQLSTLSHLSIMDVSNNKITGTIPSAYLGSLASCVFHCDNTYMCGSIVGFQHVTVAGTTLGQANPSGRLIYNFSKRFCTRLE